jgi:hypothetical protein
MKWNAWWLPLLMAGTLGMIYILPQAGKTEESAVKMELPGSTNGWSFEKIPASQDEIKTLSDDTEFTKAICMKARPGEVNLEGYFIPDRIDLSVVLSGHDLNNSIHRPERCMPAQGHTIISSRDVILSLEKGFDFKARRLQSVQSLKNSKTGKVVAQFNCVTYYFFVGHNQITNDHLERTLIDMKDRLVRGMDQRWAYVSVSMWYGKIPWIADKEVTEVEADEKLRKFLTGFTENQIDWEQIKR